MNENEDKDLYIPANCSSLDYIIEGFTTKEFAYIAAVSVIAIIIAVCIFMYGDNSFIAVILAAILIAGSIVFFRRDKYSENSIDKIRILISYFKSPKKFKYEYYNIYEDRK